jgi:hypothetical protein
MVWWQHLFQNPENSLKTINGMFLHSILIVQASMCSSFPCVSRARICKSFQEPRNQFRAWRAGTTSLFVVPEPVFVEVYGHLGIDSEIRFHMKNWFWRGHGTWAPRFHTYFLIDSRNRFFTPLHDYKYQLCPLLMLQRLAESNPRNRFLVSLNVYK